MTGPLQLGYEDLIDHDELRHDPVLSFSIDGAAGSVDEMAVARAEAEVIGKAARRFQNLIYSTLNSWSRPRGIIGKAECHGNRLPMAERVYSRT